MKRIVTAELLDSLPANHPEAIASRRDLGRINFLMGSAPVLARELQGALTPTTRQPVRIVDLGAGDGALFLEIARRLRYDLPDAEITLLDRQEIVLPVTSRKELETAGYRLRFVQADVFAWLREDRDRYTAILTNLFLHHFSESQLREMFTRVAARTDAFFAFEPRRSRRSLFFSRLVGVIGCNAVTRHDAPVSVRAGFAGLELSAMWLDPEAWTIEERPAGRFGHLFAARKKG